MTKLAQPRARVRSRAIVSNHDVSGRLTTMLKVMQLDKRSSSSPNLSAHVEGDQTHTSILCVKVVRPTATELRRHRRCKGDMAEAARVQSKLATAQQHLDISVVSRISAQRRQVQQKQFLWIWLFGVVADDDGECRRHWHTRSHQTTPQVALLNNHRDAVSKRVRAGTVHQLRMMRLYIGDLDLTAQMDVVGMMATLEILKVTFQLWDKRRALRMSQNRL